MDLAEQARKDPRVGDKWTTPDGYKTSIMDVVKVDGGWITFRAYGGVSKLDNEHFLKFVKRWTLAERGPAPATNERDPATTPVVGDEWEQNRETIKVVSINSDARVIQRITNSKRQSTAWSTPVVDWPEWVKGWRLHRKGDDPAWRPEGERSDAPAFEWAKRKCDARKAAREFSAETSADYKDAEQPAHAIKVGDRVRHNDGDKGTVDEIADSHVFTKYDSGASGRTLLSEWQQVLTIIPPAAAPDQDDTGDEPPTPERPGDPRFYAALEYLAKLHESKAADYGSKKDVFANIRATEDIGIPAWKGAWMRAKDKVKRVDSYCVNGRLKNEGVKDSFMDLAAYSIIASIMHDEQEQTK